MAKKCKVLGCIAQSERTFKFPRINDNRLMLWVSATGNEALLKIPPNNLRHQVVCGRHFEPKYVLAKQLSKSAIPTLHLPDPIPPSKTELLRSIQEPLTSTPIFSFLRNDPGYNNNEGLRLSPCIMSLKKSPSSEALHPVSIDTALPSGSSDGSGDSFNESLLKDPLSTNDSNPESSAEISGSKSNQPRRINKRKAAKRMLLLKKRKLLRFLNASSEGNQDRNMLLRNKKQQLLKRFETVTHEAVKILTKLYTDMLQTNEHSLLQRFSLTATFGKENLSKTVRTDVIFRHQKQSQQRKCYMRKNENILSKDV